MHLQEELQHLADVPVEVEVELDRRVFQISDILGWDVGSVLKLTRSAGENIDILVGGTLIGFGEIVIIEDIMGVRITDFRDEEA